ncbi:MAG: OmpA family protein [Candidatus Aminicenantes bacterium]|nr:OmpA family protein [Candidatus Aminicenantes bacterium]
MRVQKLARFVLAAGAVFVLAGTGGLFAQEEQKDAEGCKDHPLLSRMKNFYIAECRQADFDELEIFIKDEETKTVEGKKTHLNYRLKDGAQQPSQLQVRRNYTNALKTLGAALLHERDNYASWRLSKGGRETWIALQVYDDGWQYDLVILEVAAMAQEVTANEMLEALNKDGYLALYINFETGKSEVKPESGPTVDEIVALMKANPGLKLSIEGHTDSVGDPASNKTLSEARAKAVLAAVVKGGVDASRLGAVGWGQEKPVADNRTEEGRAKNRRVEIVKK